MEGLPGEPESGDRGRGVALGIRCGGKAGYGIVSHGHPTLPGFLFFLEDFHR